ncbi:hypothetical protein SEA_RUTHY_42 [Gordonia phage Ruthy]|uniref:Abortive infection protein-like C-terminal domain-containing protein n=1 Tax=Gordonia phage Ruthy TaxID=2250323 RepID=A0A345L5F3_9CAUD|nr:hypothetical protein HOT73_gp42 [Gordonia phage Ruthy]AXH50505.1 hypothetical protein SEA_RUTHY_42 [Gordonia phage Ruthy]
MTEAEMSEPARDLFAERLRKEASRAGGGTLTYELDEFARVKIHMAWEDAAKYSPGMQLNSEVKERITRSLGIENVRPISIKDRRMTSYDVALSLVEAEHETLEEWCADDTPEGFRRTVNRVFESHGIGFYLTEDSVVVPVESRELHAAVVAPATHLLHSRSEFADAEIAYANALQEIKAGDAADAITDAATALQEGLKAVGCTGNQLGDQIKSAKSQGLFGKEDSPLLEGLTKLVQAVPSKRNHGEAHKGAPGFDLDDAWLIVHIVGAVLIYLQGKRSRAAD